jgi:transposase
MPQNFIESHREQGFLLPPDVGDWLPGDHLAWFVIEAVKEMDLVAFYAAYRADGHGRAAYEPSVMVTLILYAFATDVRSSRRIECHCRQDVADRVITGNLVADHATIARFIDRHQRALAELFTEVLKLCDKAGLVESGVVSIDGTRIAGNAGPEVNYTFEQIALEIVETTIAADEAEHQELGEARGDELPEQLRSPEGRREFFRRVREQLQREEQRSERSVEREVEAGEEVPLELDADEIVGRGRQGRDAWLREGKRQLEQYRWDDPDPISRSRLERLLLAAGRLDQDLEVERRANEAYEAYRAQGRMKDGRRFGRPPNPHQPPGVPQGKVNITDPDSRPIPTGFGFVQGYNAQAAVNEQHIVLAAEITNISTDFSQLAPVVDAVLAELERAGIPRRPEAIAADAGYWNEQQMDELVADRHIPVLVAPDKGSRETPKRWLNSGRATWMRAVLQLEDGRERYGKRKQTVLPPFGDSPVDQVQQLVLGDRINAARDPATQSQRSFPSASINRTPISFNASESRAISALASASSRVRAALANPGSGRRERIQRALLSDRPELHDRRTIHPRPIRRLNCAHLSPQQRQPDLILLRRRQKPLPSTAPTAAC